jgi:hypothetical protein
MGPALEVGAAVAMSKTDLERKNVVTLRRLAHARPDSSQHQYTGATFDLKQTTPPER